MFWINSRRLRPQTRTSRRQAARPCLEHLEGRALLTLSSVDLPSIIKATPVALNTSLYFPLDDAIHGNELWKSDGTAAGTVMVKDIRPGTTGSYAREPDGRRIGTLFFAANDGSHGNELWKSDGTAAGTVLVKDINPGSVRSMPAYLTNVDGTLFFTANDGTARQRAVEERRHGRRHRHGQGHQPRHRPAPAPNLTTVERHALLHGRRRRHGNELWKSDGTAAGTVLVKDINPGTGSSGSADLTAVGRHALLHGQRRRPRLRSCGRATARPPAPRWSRTSTRAPASSLAVRT